MDSYVFYANWTGPIDAHDNGQPLSVRATLVTTATSGNVITCLNKKPAQHTID